MAIIVDAIYENGVLKLLQPLPLREHERVNVIIKPATNWVQETAGLLNWTGSPELAERFASDPELSFPAPAEE